MKQRKRMSFSRTPSFLLSAADGALSRAPNTIARLMERFGKIVARKPRRGADVQAWRQQHRMSLDEIKAQDEQEMFDTQMTDAPSRSSRDGSTRVRPHGEQVSSAARPA